MTFDFASVNLLAVGASFVAAQVFLTLFFTVLFGKPWAKAYGPGKTPAEHTQEVPKYTYGIGAACTLGLTLCLALLHAAVGVSGVGEALVLGLLLAAGLVLGTMTPGYAFLKRWAAYRLAAASQVAAILLVSTILGAWPA